MTAIRKLLNWLLRRARPPLFVVTITNGVATEEAGRLKSTFVDACSDVARLRDVRSGRIYGVRRDSLVSLDFSPEIPPEVHQSFRNVWGMYREQHRM